MEYCEEHKELFDNVVFLVEASSYERLTFWKDHFHAPHKGMPVIRTWEQESRGQMVYLGKIDKRPMYVQIWWDVLNGKRIIFYEGCSQVVDHKMIEDWLKHFTLNTIRWDNGRRWARCDAMNFHQCLDALGVLDEFNKQKVAPKDPYQLQLEEFRQSKKSNL